MQHVIWKVTSNYEILKLLCKVTVSKKYNIWLLNVVERKYKAPEVKYNWTEVQYLRTCT